MQSRILAFWLMLLAVVMGIPQTSAAFDSADQEPAIAASTLKFDFVTPDAHGDPLAILRPLASGTNPTATTITAQTPNPSAAGQAVTVSYRVTSSMPGTITGTVHIYGEGASCTGTVAQGSCSLTFTTAGFKSLSIYYDGDANYAGSSSSGYQTVTGASTAVAITAQTPDPSVAGQAVTVNYEVISNTPGTITGTVSVQVYDRPDSYSSSIGCSSSVAAGSCTLTFTTAGPKIIRAYYNGDANYARSSAARLIHTVSGAPTAIAITAQTPAPSIAGGAVTVTYDVTSNTPGTITGTVEVYRDGTVGCTGTVAEGSCALTFTTAGFKNLSAYYLGDMNYVSSQSANVGHTVSGASTAIAITNHTPDPSTPGQAVTVSYNVISNTPGTITGTVNVSSSSSDYLSCSGPAPTGSCTLIFPTPGAKTIYASYGGDANYASSQTGSIGHNVSGEVSTNPTVVATVVGHAPDPSLPGQAVTVIYSATPTSGVIPSHEKVSVYSLERDYFRGSEIYEEACSDTVVAGACTLIFATPGSKAFLVRYDSGNATYADSWSSERVAHTVSGAATTTTITSQIPGSPSVAGQAVTVNYNVNSSIPGIITGHVIVRDSSSGVWCSNTVIAGSCTLIFATAGPKRLTASYSGDAHYASSTSADVTHIVSGAPTVTTITGHTPDPSAPGQSVLVTYSATSGSGNIPGHEPVRVYASGGNEGSSCSDTVAAGSCLLIFTTPGAKTLTAYYGGDANYLGSSSANVAHTVTVTQEYALLVSTVGAGMVASNPAGINCSSNSSCSANFDIGISVTLVPTPSSGYSFGGWSGACTNTSGNCKVLISAIKKNVIATFTPN